MTRLTTNINERKVSSIHVEDGTPEHLPLCPKTWFSDPPHPCFHSSQDKPSSARRVLIVLVIIIASFIILALLSTLEVDNLSSVNIHSKFNGARHQEAANAQSTTDS